jgi:hypothetical protein
MGTIHELLTLIKTQLNVHPKIQHNAHFSGLFLWQTVELGLNRRATRQCLSETQGLSYSMRWHEDYIVIYLSETQGLGEGKYGLVTSV